MDKYASMESFEKNYLVIENSTFLNSIKI